MYKYFSFGLSIWSELNLGELKSKNSESPDITIEKGNVDFDYANSFALFEEVFYVKKKNLFQLFVKDIAIYEIKNGNQIVIQLLNNSALDEFKIFLYGTCFNVLLLQNGQMSLHGAGILKNGKVNLFIGHSGQGKSTLSTFFINQGYSFLGDDTLPLKLQNNNEINVGSSLGVVKIWEDNLSNVGLEKLNEAQIRFDVPKFRYVFHENLAEGYFPISKVFVLNWQDNESKFDLHKLSFMESIFYLKEHIYRPEFIKEIEYQSIMLKLIVSIAQQAEVYSITGNRSFENLNILKNYI